MLFNFPFVYSLLFLYRNGEVVIEPFNEPSVPVTLGLSNLYNDMIYPFMRTVIYGAIWYQGKDWYFIFFKIIF
jgi:hypothetical protein